MITKPVMFFVLHCSACNATWEDDDEAAPYWSDREAIAKAFTGHSDVFGWRRAGERYLCPACHVVDDGQVVEKETGLPAVDQAAITHAQIRYARTLTAWRHLDDDAALDVRELLADVDAAILATITTALTTITTGPGQSGRADQVAITT
ncbi:hypothetical protein [Nonomuraea typhae]|uniref:hypothetical protein n=1 Tax=Nonomuraea typhae TaxID=2603600 RepID=UPI0012FA92B1|nr:hypothetical protein [Nonomuraea typhae]